MTDQTRMITNLKCCPFCGTEVKDPVYVSCCHLPTGWHIDCTNGCVSMARPLMADVIDAWNRREGVDHD